MDRGRLWPRVRRVWATLGITATVVFAAWSLIAYRASPEARLATRSDSVVSVTHLDGAWRFLPAGSTFPARVGLLFFAGSLVDPRAYAPLARAVAESGFPAYIVELPKRGAFGGADDPELPARALALMSDRAVARRWVVAGHSRGAVIASALASRQPPTMAGLVLIGTSHPRDVDLAALSIPVTKVVGTRDGLASLAEVEANRDKLPRATRWVRVEGGNHSRFGWYGFQPGDRRATIPADAQRAAMREAVLDALRAGGA